MIDHINFDTVVLALREEDKQRILKSSKEYCVLYLNIFNAGFTVDCVLTNDYARYQNVGDNGNAIEPLDAVKNVIEADNETHRISYNIAENIANKLKHLDGWANRSAVFTHYRNNDESSLWPVRNRFNCTERAIRKLYRRERDSGEYLLGLELCLFLDDEISRIVNNQV